MLRAVRRYTWYSAIRMHIIFCACLTKTIRTATKTIPGGSESSEWWVRIFRMVGSHLQSLKWLYLCSFGKTCHEVDDIVSYWTEIKYNKLSSIIGSKCFVCCDFSNICLTLCHFLTFYANVRQMYCRKRWFIGSRTKCLPIIIWLYCSLECPQNISAIFLTILNRVASRCFSRCK